MFRPNEELIYRFELQPIRIDEWPGTFQPATIPFSSCQVEFDPGLSFRYDIRGAGKGPQVPQLEFPEDTQNRGIIVRFAVSLALLVVFVVFLLKRRRVVK